MRRIGITSSKYYTWKSRRGTPNKHNGKQPKEHWLLPQEREAIIAFARQRCNSHTSSFAEGYRRIAYGGLDANAFAVSPSTVYSVLKSAGLLGRTPCLATSSKGTGFEQPTAAHQHWHTDIKYLRHRGKFFFFISVIDGYSRYIVHHEVREQMEVADVELVIQRAKEVYPQAKPRLISDNGSQYTSKDFAIFIASVNIAHVRTSISYPQSNGKIERFHRTLKEECLEVKSMLSLEDLRRQIRDYVDEYNTQRLHSAIGYVAPADKLEGRAEAIAKERKEKLLVAQQERRRQRVKERQEKKAA